MVHPFSLKDSCYLLVGLTCVLRIWLGFLPAWGTQARAQKYGQTEVWVAFHLQQGSCHCCQLSGELSRSFFLGLPLGMALDDGKVVSFSSSLGTPLASEGLFSTARNIYYLPQLKPSKIFERFFFFF